MGGVASRGVALAAGLLALAGGSALPGAAQADDLLKAGRTAYKQFCSHCHGIDMVSAGTSSYDLRKYPKDRKVDFLKVLHEGKGAMPAWGDILTADEMEALWHYVATRDGKEEAADAAPAAPTQGNGPPVMLASQEVGPDADALETVAPGALTVCLPKNGGPMSARRSRGGAGFDYRLAERIAADAGLDLAAAWFESEQEEEGSPVKEAYALLSHGVCDLVPSFALTARALNGVAGGRGALPRWDERPDWMKPSFQVDLEPVIASRPYLRVGLGLAARRGAVETNPDLRDVSRVADMPAGVTMGVAQGTMGGVITRRQVPAALAAASRTFNPGPKFLWHMENGAFDVALVSTAAFDMHRQQNALTQIELLPYRHPIGFNIAMIGPADRPGLVEAANRTIERLGDEGLRELAEAAGVTWDAPREPWTMPPLSMSDIVAAEARPANQSGTQ